MGKTLNVWFYTQRAEGQRDYVFQNWTHSADRIESFLGSDPDLSTVLPL